MTALVSNFTGSIPKHYDEHLGPYLFSEYARDMSERVAALQVSSVLEIAAGTGIVSRQLKDALPKAAQLTISDLNQPMLDVAASKFSGDEQVEIKQADATALPFDDEAFDVLCCQFGVMFFPDKPKAYREALRVLRPKGRYIFSVWGALEENPFARVAQDTIASFFATDPPTFYMTPFGYHDMGAIQSALDEAGFSRIAAYNVHREIDIPEASHFARGLVLGNPVSEEIRTRGASDHETVIAAVADALEKSFGTNPGRMPLNAIVVEAQKPLP
ncbi:MAG: methyltransferase domain-containing protein [Hyphomicrobiaceae bacterium]